MVTNYTTSAGVQQFTINIASGSTGGETTINSTGSGAFIIYGGVNASVTIDSGEAFAYLNLSNSTTVTATRGISTAGTISVSGCIIDGDTTNLIKSIQYGTVSIASGVASGSTTISAVTNNNAAIHYLGFSTLSTTTIPGRLFPSLTLSGTTVLSTVGGIATSNLGETVGFVVIEFQGSALNQSVQNTSISWSSGSAASAGISSVVTNNAICIFGGWNDFSGSGNPAITMPYISLNTSTSVKAVLNTTASSSVTANSSIVEFVSGLLNSSVQRGTITLTGVTSNTSGITSVNASYSGINFLGNTSSIVAELASADLGQVVLTSGTIVTASKISATGNITSSWEVFEFQAYSSATPVTIDAKLYAESFGTITINPLVYTENISSSQQNKNVYTEFLGTQSSNPKLYSEIISSVEIDPKLYFENQVTGSAITLNGSLCFEYLGTQNIDKQLYNETVASQTVNPDIYSEWAVSQKKDVNIYFENISAQKQDSDIRLESVGGVSINADLPLEFDGTTTSFLTSSGLPLELISASRMDSGARFEDINAVAVNLNDPLEIISSVRIDPDNRVEITGGNSSNGNLFSEIISNYQTDKNLPDEFVASQSLMAGLPMEILISLHADTKGQVEITGSQSGNFSMPIETLANALIQYPYGLEWQGSIPVVICNAAMMFEWLYGVPANAILPLESLITPPATPSGRIIDPANVNRIESPELQNRILQVNDVVRALQSGNVIRILSPTPQNRIL